MASSTSGGGPAGPARSSLTSMGGRRSDSAERLAERRRVANPGASTSMSQRPAAIPPSAHLPFLSVLTVVPPPPAGWLAAAPPETPLARRRRFAAPPCSTYPRGVIVLHADWIVPVDGPPLRDACVAVADGRVAWVGPAAEAPAGERRELGPG